MNTARRHGLPLLAAMATTLAAGCLTAGPALADGPCGQDYTSQSACPVNSASTPTYTGSIVAADDTDYYVFHASAGTRLSLSITDTEDPSCSEGSSSNYCGDVMASVVDSQDNWVGGTDYSGPSGGLSIPATSTTILQTAGTYYLEVNGDEGSDQYGNPTPVPYSLQVTGSPAVVWPAPITTMPTQPVTGKPSGPAVRCTVPAAAHRRLGVVERALRGEHCTVGAVRVRRDRRVKRGRVITLSAPAGSRFSAGHRVSIVVSAGPRRRRRA